LRSATLPVVPSCATCRCSVQHHERHVEPSGPLAQASLYPWQASSKEGWQSSDLLCPRQNISPSSPTTSFSQLWRGVSLLYETRTTPGRVLNSRAVDQGQPKIKRGLCLPLVGALELISAADRHILISLLNLGLGDSRVSTRYCTSSVRQETIVRLLDLTHLNELCLKSSYNNPKGH
jgi:hypothetical protein